MSVDDESKSWFHNRPIAKKIDIINAWETNKQDRFEELTEGRSEELEKLFEDISDEYVESENQDVIIQDLIENGFDQQVARIITHAIKESKNEISLDLRYVKKHTSIEEQRELVIAAVDMLCGDMTATDYIDQHENGDLLQKIEALVWYCARGSQDHRREGMLELKRGMEEESGYSEERVEAMAGPVEDRFDELRQWAHENRLEQVSDKVNQLEEEISDIKIAVENIFMKIQEIKSSMEKKERSREEQYMSEGVTQKELSQENKDSVYDS